MNNQLIKKIANEYGTPLYLYDVNKIENQILGYMTNFKSTQFETQVIYASKAFSIKEMLRIVKKHNLGLDVVSHGELLSACSVDFNLDNIYYHGNNKSATELAAAIKLGVGNIVVDNLFELEDISDIVTKNSSDVNILIRLNLGIEAHTHKYIMTSHIDSKFGVIYQSEDYLEMLKIVKNNPKIKLLGFHCHIGSQIFGLEAFDKTIEKMINICKDFNYPLVLNLGGGFGAKYTGDDQPMSASDIVKHLINITTNLINKNNITIKKLCIEPGRSIVAEAGVTVYQIGNIKQTPNKLYYFVDGGMTDNIRPALYQAKYEAQIIGKENDSQDQLVTIAGKCCESGDILIENTKLAKATKGDLLVVYTTGAYGYSMMSNYNKALFLPVIFVKDDNYYQVVRRQTYQELLEREI